MIRIPRALRAGGWWPHAALLVLFLPLVRLAYADEDFWAVLMREDGWAEWATFLVFLAAGVLAARHAWRTRPGGGEALALYGLAAFCLFVAGEEISWGQRLLGYRPPDLFLERNYQQEANLHNLLKNVLDTRWMVFWFAVVYGVIAPVLAAVIPRLRALAPSLDFLPWFVVVAWLEYDYPWHLTGEFAELLLGSVVLVDVFERRGRGEGRAPGRVGALALLGLLVSAVFVAPLTDVVFYRSAGGRSPAAETEVEELRRLVMTDGVIRGKLFRKRRVHKRIFTAVQANYLDLPEDEYFLDPWHQAYWIAYERTAEGRGRAMIYSFGPNRRRDIDTHLVGDPAVAFDDMRAGDDILIGFEVRQK